jgi:pyruvate ferredoxin oxidoreductase gamma subunit
VNRPERLDVRIHGRGGQGTVTLAALLVDAAVDDGWQALGFPTFGTERTGAPVAAFVRIDEHPIRDRSEIRAPRVIVVQDPTLVGVVDLLQGVPPDGIVLLNSSRPLDALVGTAARSFPATELAMRHLGSQKTSTAMLGFFAAVTSVVSIDAVCRAIRRRFSGDVASRNEALARDAYAAGGGRVVAA